MKSWKQIGTSLLVALAIGLGAALAPAQAEPVVGTVNVNTASLEELQQLPGIGAARAAAVIAERERRGGFASVDELVEVKGIGAASLEALRPHLTTQGKTTAKLE